MVSTVFIDNIIVHLIGKATLNLTSVLNNLMMLNDYGSFQTENKAFYLEMNYSLC